MEGKTAKADWRLSCPCTQTCRCLGRRQKDGRIVETFQDMGLLPGLRVTFCKDRQEQKVCGSQFTKQHCRKGSELRNGSLGDGTAEASTSAGNEEFSRSASINVEQPHSGGSKAASHISQPYTTGLGDSHTDRPFCALQVSIHTILLRLLQRQLI